MYTVVRGVDLQSYQGYLYVILQKRKQRCIRCPILQEGNLLSSVRHSSIKEELGILHTDNSWLEGSKRRKDSLPPLCPLECLNTQFDFTKNLMRSNNRTGESRL